MLVTIETNIQKRMENLFLEKKKRPLKGRIFQQNYLLVENLVFTFVSFIFFTVFCILFP